MHLSPLPLPLGAAVHQKPRRAQSSPRVANLDNQGMSGWQRNPRLAPRAGACPRRTHARAHCRAATWRV
eukprot:679987-Pyramimonas_sp.AAC.1